MLALNGAFIPAAHKPPGGAPGPLELLFGGGAAERFKRVYAAGFPAGRAPKKTELNNIWKLHESGGGARGGFRLDRLRTEQQAHGDRWLGVLRAGLVPQRFVLGLADRTLAPRAAASYRAALPGADFVLLEASGRYPHLDAPEDVLEAFEMFQAGLSEELTPR
ncbi:MAG: hypothetical protein PVI23_09025 [Maricaulaceae bacterium]|jgi:pimeloyl-ACP methyl ester carboxylesterase